MGESQIRYFFFCVRGGRAESAAHTDPFCQTSLVLEKGADVTVCEPIRAEEAD